MVMGKRRFTCLSDKLIRMEYSPDGNFEERRSIVATEKQQAIAFKQVEYENDKVELKTACLTVVSKENNKAFFTANLEIQWESNALLQFWRPDYADLQNLGGTIRALDMLSRHADLSGVHIADMTSPDKKAMEWLSWDVCETFPQYYKNISKEDILQKYIRFDYHAAMKYHPDKMMEVMKNHALNTYKYAPGVISKSGYFFLNDSDSAVMDEDDFPIERNRPGYQDWYFFAYGNDYKSALADFIKLSGKAPLPAKNTFGLFFSRWPTYDEKEAKDIVAKFAKEEIPLSGLVLDMEWSKEGWCNWDWDGNLYKDPKAFFKWCHDKGVMVTLNVHPLKVRDDDSHFQSYLDVAGTADLVDDGEYNDKKFKKINVDICDKKQAKAFMQVCHDKIVEQGLDFWWVDGCQGKINGTCEQLVTNKIYFENVEKNNKRGMLLSRYGGLGSHRYGVFFTGDTHAEWEVFEKMCEFNIRAGHVGLAYISHDIGGFSHPDTPLIDPILYIRWIQFGVFNPTFRLHSSPGAGSRQPWDYGKENMLIAKKWLKIRNSLIPYIYTMARKHYDTGVPIVKGLFLEHPDDPKSYRYDEFYFGDTMLIAPVLTMSEGKEIYLPEGEWYNFQTGEKIKGGREFELFVKLNQIPVYVKSGSIITRQTDHNHPTEAYVKELILDIYPGEDGQATLYEDDGTTNDYKNNQYCKTQFGLTCSGKSIELDSKVIHGEPLENTRTIFIQLPSTFKPNSIQFNDIILDVDDVCSKIEENHRLQIKLPELASGIPFNLIVKFA